MFFFKRFAHATPGAPLSPQTDVEPDANDMFDAGGKFLLKEPRKKPARGTLLEYIDRLMDCNLAFEKWKQMTKCKEGCTHGCTDKSGTYKPLNMQDVCFWRTQHADRIAQEGALIKGQWLLDVVNASVIAEDAAKQMFKVAFRAEGEQKGPFLLCRECFAAMTEVKHKPQLLCWIHVHNTRPQHVHNTSTTSVHNTRPQHASAPRVHNTRPQQSGVRGARLEPHARQLQACPAQG